ncbi:MAG: hypothetical protein WAW79_10280 [Steroidobacteraceae bacterium]
MTLRNLAATSAVAMLALFSVAASAADVIVTCEKRSSRSRASVDGSGLVQGSYRAVLKSGGTAVRSAFAPAIGDEAEFDFDSKPIDIAEGATPIPANFIVDGRVKGYLVNESGQRVTPVVLAICRIRS